MKTLTHAFRTALLFATLVLPQMVQAQAQAQVQSQPNSPTLASTQPASTLPVTSGEIQPSPPGSNLVFIVRHAIAPGTGDPPGFQKGDCSSQRNLSKDGVLQAQEIGKRLKALGVAPTMIWTSEWCRAIDTAKNLGLGPVTILPALNSFFARPGQASSQMQQLERFLTDLDPAKGPYVMVTHQVVITTLTGVFPGSGEGVWLKLTGNKAKPWVVQPMAGF